MAKSRSFKGIVVVAVVLALAGGGWYYWQSRREKGPEFYTSNVTRGEVVQTITASGTIKPLLDVLVSSQISGYVTAWYTDFNAKVKKGDLLATLLPTNYQAAVKSAEGDLANAKANYDLQSVTLGRDKALLEKNLIAQSDYDSQAALVEEAAAQIKIKQASLDTANSNLSYCRITSPIDGMVISRNIDVGNSVAATLSSPTLFEIGNDLTQMQIDASVAEADVGNVSNGQAVTFSVDAYPNRQFRGVVYQVRNAPQTQQNVVIYDVMIKVDNSDLKLKPGMTANTSIIVTSHPNVLRLSNTALRFRMPENLMPPPPKEPEAPKSEAGAVAAPAAPVKQLSADEQRQALRQIFQDAGFQRGTPPTPDVIQKVQALAKERGIEIPERMMAFLTGGGRRGANPDAPVYRVIYRLPAAPGAEPEAIRVRVGITDGTNTEISGADIKEGDAIISGVNQVSNSPAPGAASPFGGGGGGGRGPGGARF